MDGGAGSGSDGSPLIGASLHALRAQLRKLAPRKAPLLLLGATGTGKEVAARWIHELSRDGHPFVPVNCAALPESLMASELFGFERGAFTGAEKRFDGRFAMAGDGTLFLDELGHLSKHGQAQLLRALEDRKSTRLGGGEYEIRARVIAATTDLESLAPDLRYRFGPVLRLPSLEDRRSDIPALVTSFQLEVPLVLAEGSMDWLMAQTWPGNVRQLRTTVERAAILAHPDHVTTAMLESVLGACRGPGIRDAGLDELLAAYEQELIHAALAKTQGNQSQAAEILKTHRNRIAKGRKP